MILTSPSNGDIYADIIIRKGGMGSSIANHSTIPEEAQLENIFAAISSWVRSHCNVPSIVYDCKKEEKGRPGKSTSKRET